MKPDDTRTEPRLDDVLPAATPASPPPVVLAEPAAAAPSIVVPMKPTASPGTATPAPVQPAAAPALVPIEPAPSAIRLILKRTIRSGLIGGKKYELTVKAESRRDLAALFKGFPDELLLAYKSSFVDKSYALRRSEMLRGTKFVVGSLNEMIELEDRLHVAFDQIKRMIAILENGDAELVIEG